MIRPSSDPANPAPGPPRLLGRRRGAAPGPTLVVVAGLHGNEPGGVEACRRVLARLAEGPGDGPPDVTAGGPGSVPGTGPASRGGTAPVALLETGEIVALAGNRRALAEGCRFLDVDLNRLWTPERMERLRAGGGAPLGDRAEDLEQAELAGAFDDVLAAARGPVTFLDLHSTSAGGVPFAMIGRGADPWDFARRFPIPVILGLLDRVQGVLLEEMRRRGCVCLGVEGGRNGAPSTVTHHEAVLWLALEALGLVSASRIPGLEGYRTTLRGSRGALPHLMEVLDRHPVAPGDGFVMEPGFANIHPVMAGQLLARDKAGEIRARESGLLFMPLYQGLGEDGFFFGREVEVPA